MRYALTLIVLLPLTTIAGPWFDGEAEFTDDESRQLAAKILQAHGGMAPMAAAKSIRLDFFTKVSGAPNPFYTVERIDLANGNALVKWPFWNASMGWDGETLWSHQWPMPMPAGFFARLTTSFVTLPWQIQADGANVGPVGIDRLPNDDTDFQVLRITFDERNPSIPGTFYDLYIDPDTHLMQGLRFDINHPGMVANPSQPLGPNFHVFGDYRSIDGMMIPTFYLSYGKGSAQGGSSNAYHFAWNIRFDEAFDVTDLEAPSGAQQDDVSMSWWQTVNNASPATTSTVGVTQ